MLWWGEWRTRVRNQGDVSDEGDAALTGAGRLRETQPGAGGIHRMIWGYWGRGGGTGIPETPFPHQKYSVVPFSPKIYDKKSPRAPFPSLSFLLANDCGVAPTPPSPSPAFGNLLQRGKSMNRPARKIGGN